MLPGFWGPGCHLNILIDLANNALASKGSINAICFFSEGYRNQIGVTGSTNFKSQDVFFFRKIVLPGIWGTWLPSMHFN